MVLLAPTSSSIVLERKKSLRCAVARYLFVFFKRRKPAAEVAGKLDEKACSSLMPLTVILSEVRTRLPARICGVTLPNVHIQTELRLVGALH